MPTEPSPALLIGYLEEALGEEELAQVEHMLRTSLVWRQALKELSDQTDLGEHSVAMIWRRQRLTCPSREKLWAYKNQAGDPNEEDYINFHITVIKCGFCQANMRDLDQEITTPQSNTNSIRRRRFYETSVGQLPKRN